MSKALGFRQLQILRSCAKVEWFTVQTHSDYVSALALNGRGLLARDLKNRMRFKATEAGLAVFSDSLERAA